MKPWSGATAPVRLYLEHDQAIAPAEYLTEHGEHLATMVEVSREGIVMPGVQMDGDTFEQWLSGTDIRTGQAKGVIRHDDHALRAVEIIVNQSRDLDIAAMVHPDVRVALHAAQDAAVSEILRCASSAAVARAGARGAVRMVPVAGIEAYVARHEYSRAGDPQSHLHVGINSRVYDQAAGKWRALATESAFKWTAMLNAVGTRTINNDPGLRRALADHGMTIDGVAGRIEQIPLSVVRGMSKRTVQIETNLERYAEEYRAEHGHGPSEKLRASWSERAWRDGRPEKAERPGEDQHLGELRSLGLDIDRLRAAGPIGVRGVAPSDVSLERVAERVIETLSADRFVWNRFTTRAAVETELAAAGVVGSAAEVTELAVAACAVVEDSSVRLLPERDLPDHELRWSSRAVQDCERDLRVAFADRAGAGGHPAPWREIRRAAQQVGKLLDEHQVRAAAAIAGTEQIAVVIGPAGAGKTAVLATAQEALRRQGRAMLVVAPSKEAANVAAGEVGGGTSTAHSLAYQHGYRWETGVWRRLAVGEVDPANGRVYEGPNAGARLRHGDVVVVDEAGMLHQETARALETIAKEAGACTRYVGDTQQLQAVGRGGVLEMATTWSESVTELRTVHRFKDPAYAELSLRIRSGIEPGSTFDDLHAGGHIRIHGSEAERVAAVADELAEKYRAGVSVARATATNDEAAVINSATRERLVTAGRVHNVSTVLGSDELPIGRGDQVMTRNNDTGLGVANRQRWRVEQVRADGGLDLSPGKGEPIRSVPAEYVAEHVHLAYASTEYGVQGRTVRSGGGISSEQTTAAGQYVAMSRGTEHNVYDMVAESVAQAREQWVATAERDRQYTGTGQAREALLNRAAVYAPAERIRQERSPLAGMTDRDLALSVQRAEQAAQRLEAARAVIAEHAGGVGPAVKEAQQQVAQWQHKADQVQAHARAGELARAVNAGASRIAEREAALAAARGPFKGGQRRELTAEIAGLREAQTRLVGEHEAARRRVVHPGAAPVVGPGFVAGVDGRAAEVLSKAREQDRSRLQGAERALDRYGERAEQLPTLRAELDARKADPALRVAEDPQVVARRQAAQKAMVERNRQVLDRPPPTVRQSHGIRR